MKYVLYELCFVHAENCCNSLNIVLFGNVCSLIWITAVVLDVPHVEDGGEDLEDLPDVMISHLQNLHGSSDVSELLGIIASLTGYFSSLMDKIKFGFSLQQQITEYFTPTR